MPDLLANLYEQGSCGVKGGKGFYGYADGRDQAAILDDSAL